MFVKILLLLFPLLLTLVVNAQDQNPPEPIEEPTKHDFKNQITKDHILEDLQYQINTKEKKDMTERELQFHYFKLHDFDNNNLLDGLEVVKALKHNHDHAEGEGGLAGANTDTDLMSIVDGVLESDDMNKDGYISFYEFMAGQESR